VNLFVPSRAHWVEGGTKIALVQRTSYPYRPETEIEVTADAPSRFPVYVRIPGWSGVGTRIAVNGKSVMEGPEPGRFARIERAWTSGDRMEMEFEMPARLEAVDAQHANLRALVRGPLALFAVGELPASVKKDELLKAAQVSEGSTDWQAKTAAGTLTLRPFASIEDETYRLYLDVEA
jgi:uncharacterized protein